MTIAEAERLGVMPELLPADRARRRSSRRLEWTVAGLFLVALLLAFGVGLVGFGSKDQYPSKWDPRVADIATDVERLRGLEFEHPVAVRFLAESKFRDDVGVGSDITAAERRDFVRLEAQLRAVGLITGDVDLLEAFNTDRQSRVLAYYSPDTKEIVVRGTDASDITTRVTLAHEMVHVLQDQHFDLNSLGQRATEADDASSDALRAVIEGDANRIEGRYLGKLAKADRDAFADSRTNQRETVDAQTETVPAILSNQSSAPYRYGQYAIDVLVEQGGNRAIDAVMRRGVFNQRLFLDPTSVTHGRSTPPVPAPKLGKGERGVGEATALGAYDGYLLLASRTDPTNALATVSGWGGARMRSFRDGGTTCTRIAIRGSGADASARIRTGFDQWAAALPAGMVTVETSANGSIVVTGCDPGADAAIPSADPAIEQSAVVLDFNDALIAEFATAGAPTGVARCLTREILESPEARLLSADTGSSVTATMVRDVIGRVMPAAREVCGLG